MLDKMFGKKFSKEPTEKQKIGKIGEDCACKYLEKNGYKVIERNYLKKWGEIDIVAKKGKKLYFIEVKSVSRTISAIRDTASNNVIRETNRIAGIDQMDEVRGGEGNGRGGVQKYGNENISLPNKEVRHLDNYRPEDNMHPWKLQRLARTIQSYLLDKDISDDIDWQFDVVTVYLDMSKRLSRVHILEDVVL